MPIQPKDHRCPCGVYDEHCPHCVHRDELIEDMKQAECGECGRSLAPDGDCFGCAADRLAAELDAVKAESAETCRKLLEDNNQLEIKYADCARLLEEAEGKNAKLREWIDSGEKVYRYADGKVPARQTGLRECYCSAIIIPFDPPLDDCFVIANAKEVE